MSAPSDPVDVLVIGAGPGGCAAAIELARAGQSVILADKAAFPRDKCCGDGLTTGALRALDRLGLDRAGVASWTEIDALFVRSPSGRIVKVPLGATGGCFGATARRRDLDASLLGLARATGVLVAESHELRGLEADPLGRSLHAHFDDQETVRARHVIAADGAHSRVRAILGKTAPLRSTSTSRDHNKTDWLAFRTYASNVAPEAATQLWVWFDQAVLPGYVWSFPAGDGSANVGVCLARRPGERGSDLQDAWRRVLSHSFLASLLGPDATVALPGRAWPIPAGMTRDRLAGLDGRVLFVGDAARSADPMTGEGIAQALHSGRAAAESIIAAGDKPGRAEERYASWVAANLAREQRLSGFFSRLLAHPFGARAAVGFTDLNAFTRAQVGRWLYEDYPRVAIMQPRNWKEIATRSPGPFQAPPGDQPMFAP